MNKEFKNRMIAALQKTTSERQYFVIVREEKHSYLAGGDFPINMLLEAIIEHYIADFEREYKNDANVENQIKRRKKAFFDALDSDFCMELQHYLQTGKIL